MTKVKLALTLVELSDLHYAVTHAPPSSTTQEERFADLSLLLRATLRDFPAMSEDTRPKGVQPWRSA